VGEELKGWEGIEYQANPPEKRRSQKFAADERARSKVPSAGRETGKSITKNGVS